MEKIHAEQEQMPENGDEISADPVSPADDEEMIWPLSDGYDSQGEDEVERIAALPLKDLAAVNLEDVIMATLQAVGKLARNAWVARPASPRSQSRQHPAFSSTTRRPKRTSELSTVLSSHNPRTPPPW